MRRLFSECVVIKDFAFWKIFVSGEFMYLLEPSFSSWRAEKPTTWPSGFRKREDETSGVTIRHSFEFG
jgi:hypothetical protein